MQRYQTRSTVRRQQPQQPLLPHAMVPVPEQPRLSGEVSVPIPPAAPSMVTQDEPQAAQPKKRKRTGGRSNGASHSTLASPASSSTQHSSDSMPSTPAQDMKVQQPPTVSEVQVVRGQRRGGRRRGSMNFSAPDVTELLRLVRLHMPAGQHGWQKVCTGYNVYASTKGQPKRDVISLRSKYYKVRILDMLYILLSFAMQLVNARKPTGDPDCPPDVREAKRIEREIQERVCLGIVNDDDPVPEEWDDANSGEEMGDDAGSIVESSGEGDGEVGDGEGENDDLPPVKRPKIDEVKVSVTII